MNKSHDLSSVTLPVRNSRDWRKATTGTCSSCGKWGAILDGQCAECHDADFEAAKEEVYQTRIRELIAENEALKARLSDA